MLSSLSALHDHYYIHVTVTQYPALFNLNLWLTGYPSHCLVALANQLLILIFDIDGFWCPHPERFPQIEECLVGIFVAPYHDYS